MRQPDLQERLSSRPEVELEVAPVAQEIFQLQKEVERLKRQQELSRKWLKLWTECRYLRQELPTPSFLMEDVPQPSNNQPMQSKVAPSRRSEHRQSTPLVRNKKNNTLAKRAISEVGES